MSEESNFLSLIARVQQGDGEAADELVRVYEPLVRRAIRVRMNDATLRRLLDSMDICQSVFGNFFVRVASGQLDIETPGELVNLLVAMAKNRLLDWHRHRHRQKRDQSREQPIEPSTQEQIKGSAATASRILQARELLQQVRDRLDEGECRLMDLRSGGLSWPEIGEQLGEAPNTLRVRLQRALDRIVEELGIDELS